MKVANIRFEPGGGHNGLPDTHWAFVTLELIEHDAGEGNPFVRVDIPVFFNRDTTMGDLREHVTKLAIETLQLSAKALSENPWPEIEGSLEPE